MVVFLGKALVDMDGKELPNGKGAVATVKSSAMEALLALFEDERALSGEDKFKRWELAKKINSTPDPVDLSTEELALIKKLVGKAYPPLVSGQIWEFLEKGTVS